MLPFVLIPVAEIVTGIVGAIVARKLTPKKINIDMEFD
jgi:hypothetical protein